MPAGYFDQDAAEQLAIEHSIPIHVAKVVILLSENIENEAEMMEMQSILVQMHKKKNITMVGDAYLFYLFNILLLIIAFVAGKELFTR